MMEPKFLESEEMKDLKDVLGKKTQLKLLNNKFKLIQDSVSGSFDHQILIYEYKHIKLRIVQDRGSLRYEISSTYIENWISLLSFLCFIKESGLEDIEELQLLIDIFLDSLDVVLMLLDKDYVDQTVKELKRINDQETREFIKSLNQKYNRLL